MVKVKITFNGISIDYDFNRESPLATTLDVVCTQLNATGPRTDYTLQLDSTRQYITSSDLTNPNFQLNTGAAITLKLTPAVAAQRAVEGMRDPKKSKLAIFELQKSQLLDDAFTTSFLQYNGMPEIVKFVSENQGSSLAHGLKALYHAMRPKTGWESITEAFCTTYIFANINSSNINVCRSSLEVAALIARSESMGFGMADKCIHASNPEGKMYQNVVNALASTDVSVQASALELINALCITCPDHDHQAVLDQHLEALNMAATMRNIVKAVQDEKLKLQCYIYQALKLRRLAKLKETTYDKTNPQHEETLMSLWKYTFPDVALSGRISEQWKVMGFQGTDPSTDFRGMGFLGLKNLVYFASQHGDEYRALMNRNIERKERDYPAAVAGINITQMLFECLNAGKPINFNGPPLKLFRVIFDNPTAFEEIYCKCFTLLDAMWDQMNASYMDFPKVSAAIKKQLEHALSLNPSTVEAFCGAMTGDVSSAMSGGGSDFSGKSADHPQMKAIRLAIHKEVTDMVLGQKIDQLKDGVTMQALGKTAKEKKGAPCMYLKLDPSGNLVNYTFVATVTDSSNQWAGAFGKAEVKAVVFGAAAVSEKKAKKLGDLLLKRAIGIQLKDTRVFSLLAATQTEYVAWLDGLRLFLGLPMQEKDNLDEIHQMAELISQIRLLGLMGVDLPEGALPVPDPPSNFNFPSEDFVESFDTPQ